MAEYNGCFKVMVAQSARIVAALSLEHLSITLKEVWALSISVDCGNQLGVNYLDLPVSVYEGGDLRDIMLLPPLSERKKLLLFGMNLPSACYKCSIPTESGRSSKFRAIGGLR